MADKNALQTDIEKIIQNGRYDSGIVLNRDLFITPDITDIDKTELNTEYLDKVEQVLDSNAARGMNAAFYVEEPYTTKLGYHPEADIFCVKSVPTWRDRPIEKEINKHDGDTVYFSWKKDVFLDGGQAFTIGGKVYNSVYDYIGLSASTSEVSELDFGVRFLGVNSPEITHWITVPCNAVENHWTKMKLGDVLNKTHDAVYRLYVHQDKNEEMSWYIDDKGIYHEIKLNDDNETFYKKTQPAGKLDKDTQKMTTVNEDVYFIVNSDATTTEDNFNDGMKAQAAVMDLIDKADDMVILLDAKTVSKVSVSLPEVYKEDFWAMALDTVKGIWTNSFAYQFTYLGFNNFGQEVHKRFLGCIYVKVDLNKLAADKSLNVTSTQSNYVWVNVSKYMLAHSRQAEALKDYSRDPLSAKYFSFYSDAFKVWTYDQLTNGKYIDSLEEMTKDDIDDRRNIQKTIMGMEWDTMKDWTVMIGDCLFMVPPTSIRCISQMENEKMPLMRARGSMIKGAQKMVRTLEFTMYFNEEGINGVPYDVTLPNGEKTTYYMNGLRALIAQFKLTPFLPIENGFINESLNIEAVTLNNLQISTVEGYPKCLAATLAIEEFDYRIYMPELPIPDPNKNQDVTKNLFASTIHYETMRWFYQQPILRGEDAYGQSEDNIDYVAQTFGGKTVLQPMHFGDSSIKFYTPDKDYLDTQLQLKLNALAAPIQIMMPETEGQKNFMINLQGAYKSVTGLFSDPNLTKLFDTLYKPDPDPMGDKNLNFELLLTPDESQVTLDMTYFKEKPVTLVTTHLKKEAYNGHGWNVEPSEAFYKEINSIFEYITTGTNGLLSRIPGATSARVEEVIEHTNAADVVTWKIYIGLDTSMIGTRTQWIEYKTTNIESKMLNVAAGTALTDDGEVIIQLKAQFAPDKNRGKLTKTFSIQDNCPGMTFLRYCGNSAFDPEDFDIAAQDAQQFDTDVVKNQQDYMMTQKEKIDLLSAESIKFGEYPIGNVEIKTVACILGNTMSRITLQSTDTYAPQYMGGQDTTIEVIMQTTDDVALTMLKALPDFSTSIARDYRQILNAWPLRIDSEITRMLSINEVIIESVDISTTPGVPGLYTIVMRIMSLDRSLKNREALSKLDTEYNNGSIATSSQNSTQTKNYFEIDKALSHAELYPDLEMPTIDELSYAGFKFIKYANATNIRSFPDPDFYFIYAHVLQSQVMKEAIKTFFEDNPDIKPPTFTVEDLMGGLIELQPSKKGGAYVVKDANNTAMEIGQNAEAFKKTIKDMVDQMKNESKDMTNVWENDDYGAVYSLMAEADFTRIWHLSTNLQIHLREDTFKSQEKGDDEIANDILLAQAALVGIIEEELKKPMSGDWISSSHKNYNESAWTKAGGDYDGADQVKHIKNGIGDFVKDFFANGAPGDKLMDGLSIKDEGKSFIRDNLSSVLIAAAAAKTGQFEYESGTSTDKWYPKMLVGMGNFGSDGNVIPMCKVSPQPGIYEEMTQASSFTEAVEKGSIFGMYQIKQYASPDALANVTGEMSAECGGLLVDPYYRNASYEEKTKYKKMIMTEAYYATYAFVRNSFKMLERLLKNGVSLSLFDVIQNIAIDELKSKYGTDVNVSPAPGASSGGNKSYGKPTDLSNLTPTGGGGGASRNSLNTNTNTNTSSSSNASSSSGEQNGEKIAEGYSKQYTSSLAFEEYTQNVLNKDPATMNEQEMAIRYSTIQDDAIAAVSKNIMDILNSNYGGISLGKMALPMIVMMMEADSYLYQLLQLRDYDNLDGICHSVGTSNAPFQIENGSMVFDKFMMALVGTGIAKDPAEFGAQPKDGDTTSYLRTLANECVYLEESDNPYKYIQDSFYDMIMNDKRGRMARAFPTFYMLFVDEGRQIGYWKLHDNFYTMSSISEIEVVKSRKMAADTAHIVMSNMFKTFISDDEDQKIGYNDYTWKDAFNSIFSPRIYYIKEELRRQYANPAVRAVIQPGIRIHLRAGYGGDASQLPILFNGVMAEVQNGDVIDIIAQGDGIELTYPLLSEMDAEDVQYNDQFIVNKMWKDWVTKGATPRTILGSILTTKGGFMRKTIFNWTNGRFFNENPYGIVHFGEPEYTAIFTDGECLQNIYEGSGKPSWGDGSGGIYSIMEKAVDQMNNDYDTYMAAQEAKKNNTDYVGSGVSEQMKLNGPPLLSTQIYGKSYWDIMNICASACPDYVTGVAPFGMRSTIFFGAPRFYYAYAYEEDSKSMTPREKRKPFQQYHIYTSYSDIIGNGIIASEKDVRTCAVGTYTTAGWLGKTSYKRTEPLWVSIDIYPEKQKTMTVDTQLSAKGTALGDIVPFMNWMQNELGEKKDTDGNLIGGHALAWRMTASALKNAVKDMYKGQLMIIGDPSVKPLDRMWISDIYERMQGCCEVEAVTHSLSVEGGFTTTINPDCIATIDDRNEQIIRHMGDSVASKAITAASAMAIVNCLFGRKQKPLLTSLAKFAAKNEVTAEGFAQKLGSLFGKEDAANNEQWLQRITKVNNFFNIDVKQVKFSNYVSNLKNAESLFKFDGEAIKTLDDLASSIGSVGDGYNKINPYEQYRQLQDIDPNVIKNEKDREAFIKARDALQKAANDGFKVGNNSATYAEYVADNLISADDMKVAQSAIEKLLANPNNAEALKDTSETLQKLIASGGCKTSTDMKTYASIIKTIGGYTTEMGEDTAEAIRVANAAKLVKTATAGVKAAETVTAAADGLEALEAVSEIGLATAGTGILPALAFMAAQIAVTWALSAFANEYIERYLKSLQVLQVFPMTHNGKPLVAGLDGAKGAVVGAPGYEDPGLVGGFVENLFQKDHTGLGSIWDFVRGALDMPKINEIIDNYKHDNNFKGENIGTSDADRTGIIANLLQSMGMDEMKKTDSYKAMLMQNRVQLNQLDTNASVDSTTKDVTNKKALMAYNKYKVTDTSQFEKNDIVVTDPAIVKDMIYIGSGQTAKSYMDNGWIKLLHEDDSTLPYAVTRLGAKFSIEKKDIPSKVIRESIKAPTIYDVPFLRPDAYYLFLEIVNQLNKNKNNGGNDYYGADKWFTDHKIILTSCLRVGDKTWSNTGYKFTVQVTNSDDEDILGKVLSTIEQDANSTMNGLKKADQLVFLKVKIDNNKYSVLVFPPEVGSVNTN